MVRARPNPTHRICLIVLFALMYGSVANADVIARVDRERVERNESFSLELIVDSGIDNSPDLTVLEEDFTIVQASRLSNTRIERGEIMRSMTWSISLMANRAGELTIPPIKIGDEESNPVSISVREPSYEPPGEADVFITSELDFAETWVQAQVLYTIKIYHAVATRQGALREPAFTGAEVLVELAGDQRNYEATLNDRTYNVIERSFAIFPQESGTIEISPARFEARVLKEGRITGRKVFESQPQSIVVLPIPAPPEDYPDAAWLPAKEVTLGDEWSRDPGELSAGEPISRNISISALGQLETQVPVLEPPVADGVSIYPDKPVFSRRMEVAGIRGIRTDQYAMIGVRAGDVVLPGIELPWWDIEAREWRVARLPERSVSILPGDDALLIEPVAEPVVAEVAELAPGEPQAVPESGFWRRVAEILAVLWLMTLLGWWWSSRPSREHRMDAEHEPPPIHKQQARQLKLARQAAMEGDAGSVRSAMLEWGRLQWPDAAPRSIGELASRVTAPLSDELRNLSSLSYGPAGVGWKGELTAKAIRSFAVLDEDKASSSTELLPPLMPGT